MEVIVSNVIIAVIMVCLSCHKVVFFVVFLVFLFLYGIWLGSIARARTVRKVTVQVFKKKAHSTFILNVFVFFLSHYKHDSSTTKQFIVSEIR